jgi:hypothetical protein
MNERPRGIPLRPDWSARVCADRESFVRCVTAIALAERWGKRPAELLKRTWPGDRQAEIFFRAATSPASTDDFPSSEALATLVALAPQSAALRLFEQQLRLQIGANASVRIPNVASPPTAAFVAELSPGPVLQGTLGAALLGPTKKILILATLSEELERAGPESASVSIGHLLGQAAAKAIDAVAFDAAPVDDIRPPGLLNGVTPLTPTAGGGLAAIAGDLGTIAKAMADANVDPEDLIIVAAPRQATTLRLLAGPRFTNEIFGTTALADKTVVGFARGAVASSFEGAPSVDVVKGATIHSANPASPVMAAPTTSLYQQALLGVKLRQRGAWCVTMPGGVQRINNVTW